MENKNAYKVYTKTSLDCSNISTSVVV